MVTDAMVEAGANALWARLDLNGHTPSGVKRAASDCFTAMHTARPATDPGEYGELVGCVCPERLSDMVNYGIHACREGKRIAPEDLYITRPTTDLGELTARLRAVDSSIDELGGDIGTCSYRNPDGPEAATALETQAATIARLREGLETADYRLHLIIEDAMEGGRSKEVAVYQAWRNDIRAALSPNPTSP